MVCHELQYNLHTVNLAQQYLANVGYIVEVAHSKTPIYTPSPADIEIQ